MYLFAIVIDADVFVFVRRTYGHPEELWSSIFIVLAKYLLFVVYLLTG